MNTKNMDSKRPIINTTNILMKKVTGLPPPPKKRFTKSLMEFSTKFFFPIDLKPEVLKFLKNNYLYFY